MSEFAKGDCVRVDIPDTSDPDFAGITVLTERYAKCWNVGRRS